MDKLPSYIFIGGGVLSIFILSLELVRRRDAAAMEALIDAKAAAMEDRVDAKATIKDMKMNIMF